MRLAVLAAMLAACLVSEGLVPPGMLRADVRNCVCDLAAPDLAQIKGCSLCKVAAEHPASEHVILLRDNDPTKPNRWLVIPHAHIDGSNPLMRMDESERLAIWKAAIAKGRELWGEDWGVAMNGDIARRQCHPHMHVGKLLAGKETDNGYYIEGPSELPAIADGTGLWFHSVSGRLHVHLGEQITETVLMR